MQLAGPVEYLCWSSRTSFGRAKTRSHPDYLSAIRAEASRDIDMKAKHD